MRAATISSELTSVAEASLCLPSSCFLSSRSGGTHVASLHQDASPSPDTVKPA